MNKGERKRLVRDARRAMMTAAILRKEAVYIERQALKAVPPPHPGAFVRDTRDGRLYVVRCDLSQGGRLMLDAFKDNGMVPAPTEGWLHFDLLEDGVVPDDAAVFT